MFIKLIYQKLMQTLGVYLQTQLCHYYEEKISLNILQLLLLRGVSERFNRDKTVQAFAIISTF